MLANVVKKLLGNAKKNGGSLTPAEMSRLEREASLGFDGAFCTVTQPMAPNTWEAQAVMLSATPECERIDLRFSRPVEIVGCYPSLVTVGAVGRDATLNDLAIQIDIDRQAFKTIAIGETSGSNNFVTLGSLGVDKRLMGLRIDTSKPSVGVTFRWRVAPGTCKDTLVAVALFCRWIG